ncbi:hypothetical protein Mag101_13030 [Microbulbifer agarilyticus]|uniref:O-antigen ligase-related domain-containing protein n=2 Tax=Microbulbifer agarilyticus TaxID=260552 RepID=A0A1Q2M898_9GAMM|nr:hypothetical protein Mag101_13030 [Microbulbifer agarilyticus]
MGGGVLLGILLLHGLMLLKALAFLMFELAAKVPVRAEMLYPGVENTRFFNQVQVFMVPLLYVWLARSNYKTIACLFLFINLLLAFAGGARGLLVGLIAGGLVAYVLLKPWRAEVLKAACVCVIACVSYLLLQLLSEVGERADAFRAHSSGRITIWINLIEALGPAHFWLGEGTGSFSYHDFKRHEGHPHNSLLQFIYEWGALGAGAAIVSFACVLLKAYKFFNQSDNCQHQLDITAGLAVSLVSAGFYSLFSGLVVMPMPQTLLFLFAGILLGGLPDYLQSEVAGVHASPKLPGGSWLTYRYLVWGVAFILFGVYLHLFGTYLLQQAELPEVFKGPRFWAQGAQMKWEI